MNGALRTTIAIAVLLLGACGTADMTLPEPGETQPDAGAPEDAGTIENDAGSTDAGEQPDAGDQPDAGAGDAGTQPDAGEADAGPRRDITPPVFSGVSSAQARSETEVEVSWGIATDDTTPAAGIQYLVYLSVNSPVATGGAPNQVVTNATSYRFTNLIPGTRYYALVRARDEAGNVDNNNREVSATTPDASPPSIPANVSVTALGAAELIVEWEPSADNGSAPSDINYLVAISETAGGTATAPSFGTPTGVTSLRLSGLTPATTYYVAVRAQDVAGNRSAFSQEVSAATLADTTAPRFGGASSATAIGPTGIRISWGAAVDDVTPQSAITYRVYMGTTPGNIDFGTPVQTVTGALTAVIDELVQDTEYHFVVRATDEAGNTDTNLGIQSARTQKDVAAPSFGGLTSAVSTSPTEIELSWSAASDNVTPSSAIVYDIYLANTTRGQDFDGAPAATTGPGETSFTLDGLTPETRYYIVVRARDGAGNRDSNTVERMATTPAVPDTLAPMFAGVTSVSAVSATSIEAEWTAATDDRSTPEQIVYNVYVARSSGGQDWQNPTTTTPAGATSAVVTNLDPETEYFVVVRAKDAAGNEDGNTTEKFATTPELPDEVKPTFAGLASATAISQTEIELTWAAGSDDTTAAADLVYRIYQATSSGGQDLDTPVATTDAGATSYTVSGLSPGTEYFFVVRAVDESGNEDENAVEKSATTSSAPDTTPPTFAGASSATAISDSEIKVAWAAATDSVTAQDQLVYNLYVAESAGAQNFASPTLSTPAAATEATLTGLAPETTYFIVVRAVDEAGNVDANVVEVSATTEAAPE